MGDRCCSGCALVQPAGSFACLRPYDKLVGESRQGAARRLVEPAAVQAQEWTVPTAAGHRLGSRVGPAFQACAWLNLNPARPGPGLGTKAPLPLGLSQGHEEAAAVTAALVKVTSPDYSGERGSERSGWRGGALGAGRCRCGGAGRDPGPEGAGRDLGSRRAGPWPARVPGARMTACGWGEMAAGEKGAGAGGGSRGLRDWGRGLGVGAETWREAWGLTGVRALGRERESV